MSIEDANTFLAKIISIAFHVSGGPEMIFRGVTDESYKLTPSIGRRTSENTNDIESLEGSLLKEFKRLSVPVLKTPPTSDIEWLVLAQHYGLPTRLLDWSSNPLVALFFAVEKDDDVDGALHYIQHMVTDQYHLFDYRTADYTEEMKAGPAGIYKAQPEQETVIFFRPSYTDDRYMNQRSIFSCPANPFIPLSVDGLQKITVPRSLKFELRKRLRTLGISTSHIYPGLAGIASEVKSHIFDPVTAGREHRITIRGELKLQGST